MAASWLLQAIYASVLSQSALTPRSQPTDQAPTFVTTHTSYGDLKGVRRLTDSNVAVDHYLGIPFALPPMGQRRFSKPEPPTKWSGVRDATAFANECHQKLIPEFPPFVVGDKPVAQSEDCLYLNIYTPAAGGKTTTAQPQPLPVMVWIHGGGYFMGAGSQYDGFELAVTGVVVVTINYRLDVFGFLSNEGSEIPGNFGMLDQIMALKWVKENVRSFGGDPDKVTIFGESAGAGSVSLLVLSPLAAGLFNRAIMESGVSLSTWATSVPAARITPKTLMSLIGLGVGCTEYDVTKKLQCFRTVDASALLNVSMAVQTVYPSTLLHAPRVDNSFLPDFPANLMSKDAFNHVDTLRGFTVDEAGYSFVLSDPRDDGFTRDELALSLKDLLAAYAIPNVDQLTDEVINGYVGNLTDPKLIRRAGVDAYTDFQFRAPAILEVNAQSGLAKGKGHYVYEFEYRASFSLMPPWLKAVHGDDLTFVFGVNRPAFRKRMMGKIPNKDDISVWNQVKTLWSNFAKYGNPTQTVPSGAVSWAPYDVKDARYLKIDVNSQMMSYNNSMAINFSRNLLKELHIHRLDDAIIG